VKLQRLVVRRIGEQRDIDEVRKLALMTGAEKNEIDEMVKSDKVYTAQKRGMIIGFVALKSLNRENVVEVSGLATKETERRKGTAAVLVRYVEEIARSMNAQKLLVKTSNDNIPALALYQKNGFRITEIKIGAMVKHHGAELAGWENIPIRDEVILEKILSR
jgi:N-acetylglutamate synthase-like GNAT family acetyltransferase